MMKLRLLCLGAATSIVAACHQVPPPTSGVAAASAAAPIEVPTRYLSEHEVSRGSSFYNSLRALGIDSSTIFHIVDASQSVFKLKELSAGTRFSVSWTNEEEKIPLALELKIAADSSLMIERKEESNLEWTATRINYPVTLEQKTFTGVVDSSLWESADLVGMDPSLITSLSEVFAWQVDFSREVQRGDRWRLTVEQKKVGDEVIGWGNILVAEYNRGDEQFTGVRYPQTGDNASYYSLAGQNLKQMFLKSPLKFGRVTSGFNKARFHPILKVARPHNGVDYGAPSGTPVMSVGRGTVVSIGPNGGSGNMIKIQHNGTYATAYLHLKGFASGLRKGSVVEQGQLIGYVGSTGLSTGPHLHFSFYEGGKYIDPLGKRFAAADPISKSEMANFKQAVASIVRTLPDWQIAHQGTGSSDLLRNYVRDAE